MCKVTVPHVPRCAEDLTVPALTLVLDPATHLRPVPLVSSPARSAVDTTNVLKNAASRVLLALRSVAGPAAIARTKSATCRALFHAT